MDKDLVMDMDIFINDENIARYRRLASRVTTEHERVELLHTLARLIKALNLTKSRHRSVSDEEAAAPKVNAGAPAAETANE